MPVYISTKTEQLICLVCSQLCVYVEVHHWLTWLEKCALEFILWNYSATSYENTVQQSAMESPQEDLHWAVMGEMTTTQRLGDKNL